MEIAINPDAGAELMLANWILEELAMPGTNATRIIVAQCVRLAARDFKLTEDSLKAAAEFILKRAEMAKLQGEKVNRFWFEDQKYLTETASQATVGMFRPDEPMRTQDEGAGPRWEDMPERWRKANPRIGEGRG